MQEDNYPDTPAGATTNAQDSGPDDQGIAEMPFEDSASESYPELEIMRDASLRSENILLWPNQSEDRLKSDLDLVEVIKQKETDTLTLELVSNVSPLQAVQSQEPFCDLSEKCPEILDSNNANSRFTFDSNNAHAAIVSPKLTVQPTPPAQQPMQNKKRRHQYDDVTVLSDRSMKEQINDCSGILRKWKEPQKDTLGRWKWHKKIKKDSIFVKPLLTGLCDDLREAYKKGFVSSKPHLSLVEEICPQVVETSSPMDGDNMAIEHLQDLKMPAEDNCIPDSPNISSSSPSSLTLSPALKYNYSTPVFGTGTSSLLDLVETTYGVSPNLEDSTRRLESDNVTPVMLLKDLPGVEDTLCTDIVQCRHSGDGELAFLAEDDNIQAETGPKGTSDDLQRHLGTSEFEDLSARTRAVAHFLKERSSVTLVAQNQSGNISLKTILEGKRRKLCSQMIYETLEVEEDSGPKGTSDNLQQHLGTTYRN